MSSMNAAYILKTFLTLSNGQCNYYTIIGIFVFIEVIRFIECIQTSATDCVYSNEIEYKIL